MKCECFSCITDLLDYLQNNLLIAHYCGFNIMKPLPSYWTLERFIKEHENGLLQKVMQSQVQKLYELGILDASFIALDSTPISANTSQNNPKSFKTDKFKPENQPASDKDCGLGVHTASNQHSEKKYEFFWGYKNHILVDCITGLPINEITTTADVADSTVTLDILKNTNEYLSVKECSFIADKAYDVKVIYNTVKNVYEGECYIPLNKRNTKNPKKLPSGRPVCDAGLVMNKDGKTTDNGRTRQKYCCPFRQSRSGCCPCNHKNWNNGKTIIKTGTTERKTEAAINTSLSLMITDYLSTEIVFLSKRFMPCVPKLSVTTLASSKLVRNGSGFTALMLFRTLIPSLISLCLRLRSPLLSLTQIILYAASNPLKESLNLLLSYFSTQLCAFLRMVWFCCC